MTIDFDFIWLHYARFSFIPSVSNGRKFKWKVNTNRKFRESEVLRINKDIERAICYYFFDTLSQWTDRWKNREVPLPRSNIYVLF